MRDATEEGEAAGGTGPEVITLGCRLNAFESEAMKAHARAAGHTALTIVNTCAVTAEAVRQARQTIRRLKRENPARRIVVTGCAAQTEPETFAQMGEVAQVIGNAAKLRRETWQEIVRPQGFGIGASERVLVNDIMSVRETAGHLVDGLEGRVRAFVQVQNGCDHRCTFCIIPFGRGPSRSVPMGEAVEQIRRLTARGIREVVLTGVDLAAYGQDLPGAPGLGRLIEAILHHVPELNRLRISSLDSAAIDARLFALLKEEKRLMPHLHLSLQAGDNLILKRMKRRHTREAVIEFCAALREARPGFVFGADIIAGFPTETDAMFANSLRLIEEAGITHLHIFPYSARQGTPAARMPQLTGAVIKARAARLRAAGQAMLVRHLVRRLGYRGPLLVEGKGIGRLEDYTAVRIEGVSPGTLAQVAVTGHDRAMLLGRLDHGGEAGQGAGQVGDERVGQA